MKAINYNYKSSNPAKPGLIAWPEVLMLTKLPHRTQNGTIVMLQSLSRFYSVNGFTMYCLETTLFLKRDHLLTFT